MFGFSTGLSAIRTSQTALETVAQNIANANTPGYHRQLVRSADNLPLERSGFHIGTGVHVSQIQQIRDGIVEAALTSNLSFMSDLNGRLEILQQIETMLLPNEGSLLDQMGDFFGSLERMSADPAELAHRQAVLQSAHSLMQTFSGLDARLNQLSNALHGEAVTIVNDINNRSEALAELNRQIDVAEARGITPNDLLDRRGQLVNELAELVDARLVKQGPNHSVILTADGAALIGREPLALQVSLGEDGRLTVTQGNDDRPLSFAGGRLAGLIAARNDVTELRSQLSTLAGNLAWSVDSAHATGISLQGSFQSLTGTRGIDDPAVPLSAAETLMPIQPGELYISISDLTTGGRTLHRIPVSPDTQSLEDLAAAISNVHHVQALVDSQTGTLTILAEPGYAFDFAARLETTLDTSGNVGTSVPALHGVYEGEKNDQFTFTAVTSGTVGVTPGLIVEVRNAAGDLTATLDVGSDYEPGTPLLVAEGVSVSFESGTLEVADGFTSAMVAQADTAGILAALGLNSLFVGTAAGNLEVDPRILEDPSRFAASRTGYEGDGANLDAILATRDASQSALEGRSFEDHLSSIITEVGHQVQVQNLVAENTRALTDNLESQRMSISGVDPNEELVTMLQHQRSFQAAARYIAALDDTLTDLFRILD